MKLKVYPVAIAVLLLGILVFLLGRLNLHITVEQTSPVVSSPPPPVPQTPLPETPLPRLVPPSPSQSSAPGQLRVSNQTLHPIRVALLLKPTGKKSYLKPAHWDFAPQEGASQGLILSLPDRNLEIKPGDILVAFAQDGSRQYWGPYVVGETALPIWNNTAKEWLLILQ